MRVVHNIRTCQYHSSNSFENHTGCPSTVESLSRLALRTTMHCGINRQLISTKCCIHMCRPILYDHLTKDSAVPQFEDQDGCSEILSCHGTLFIRDFSSTSMFKSHLIVAPFLPRLWSRPITGVVHALLTHSIISTNIELQRNKSDDWLIEIHLYKDGRETM